jgi:hypothetical protein
MTRHSDGKDKEGKEEGGEGEVESYRLRFCAVDIMSVKMGGRGWGGRYSLTSRCTRSRRHRGRTTEGRIREHESTRRRDKAKEGTTYEGHSYNQVDGHEEEALDCGGKEESVRCEDLSPTENGREAEDARQFERLSETV